MLRQVLSSLVTGLAVTAVLTACSAVAEHPSIPGQVIHQVGGQG
jgi:hypothetical protein